MRLALFLRPRRRLMQFDPTKTASSSIIQNSNKRSFVQQASALQQQPKPDSSKVPRIATIEPSSFSFSRRATNSPNPSTSAHTASPMPQASSSRPSRGFAKRPPYSNLHGSSKLPNKRGGKPHRNLEGPLHDQAFITQTHRMSEVPLKTVHESTPKSSLGNFSMLAVEKLPTYKFTEGSIFDETTKKSTSVWRQVYTHPDLFSIF